MFIASFIELSSSKDSHFSNVYLNFLWIPRKWAQDVIELLKNVRMVNININMDIIRQRNKYQVILKDKTLHWSNFILMCASNN